MTFEYAIVFGETSSSTIFDFGSNYLREELDQWRQRKRFDALTRWARRN